MMWEVNSFFQQIKWHKFEETFLQKKNGASLQVSAANHIRVKCLQKCSECRLIDLIRETSFLCIMSVTCEPFLANIFSTVISNNIRSQFNGTSCEFLFRMAIMQIYHVPGPTSLIWYQGINWRWLVFFTDSEPQGRGGWGDGQVLGLGSAACPGAQSAIRPRLQNWKAFSSFQYWQSSIWVSPYTFQVKISSNTTHIMF